MTEATGRSSGLDRRGFIQLAAAGAGMPAAVTAARSETSAALAHQPSPSFTEDLNTAGIVVATLTAWNATSSMRMKTPQNRTSSELDVASTVSERR